MSELQDTLPSGWDCRYDIKTGKPYFINHYTKTTTWEDPRNKHRLNSTPLHVQNASVEYIPMQDMRSNSRMSPLLLQTSNTQDSSLTNVPDTDDSVTKIRSMFPTVSETHIRLLLKKYMKSIFPKAEETVILDILSNNDNHIQKASDALKEMGYERKDPAKVLQQQAEAKLEEQKAKQLELLRAETPQLPKIKTTEEKNAIKVRLEQKYEDIPERVISIALDSVKFDEDRANQILQIMVQEDNKNQSSSSNEIETVNEEAIQVTVDGLETVSTSQSRQSLKSLLKFDKTDNAKDKSFCRVIEESNMNNADFKSHHLSNTYGANRGLAKGANDKLLLVDYVSWHGPDPEIHIGPKAGLARGPDKANLSNRSYKPTGPNPDLQKGPKMGLAKGSIFQKLRSVVSGESRGK